MINSVNLTAGTRQVLLSQQQTAALTEQTTRNISTGRKVNSINDNPAAYFQARGLSNRASDLLAVKDSIGQSLHAVETASVGLHALGDSVAQIRAIASNARGGSAAERQESAQLFDRVAAQLDTLASDASYSGVGLISGSPQDLDVAVNENGQTLTISGAAADSAGLGIGSAGSDYGNLATDANIDAALAKLDAAINAIRAREQSFATDVSVLNIREQFNEDLGNTLQVGSDELTAADLDEQAANLLALQVRQKLGNVSLNLIAEKNNAIADLF
ncbi:MAG: hypothetical protein ISR53_05270 [Rhodospirillales bacterium]|nr:hypothetical protein [Rhodospirillales bacterium]